jgi:membrane protease YdiL (CAAX protease family)
VSLLRFFSLTYAVTWTFWLAAAAISGGAGPPGQRQPGLVTLVFLLGTFSPSFVALWMTARSGGGAAVRVLLAKLFEWRVGGRWYLFAIGYMAAIKLTTAVVHRVATDGWPQFGREPWYLLLAATLFSVLVFGQAGEEIGWRGFALPRLAARMGLARGSIVLGVIWACWHLPLFFVKGADTMGQSFPVYLLQVTALSVAIAWLYAHTNRSLLLTMLMHSAVNNTKDIVPSAMQGAANPFALSTSPVAWITVALMWLAAGWFLMRMPKLEARPDGVAPATASAASR